MNGVIEISYDDVKHGSQRYMLIDNRLEATFQLALKELMKIPSVENIRLKRTLEDGFRWKLSVIAIIPWLNKKLWLIEIMAIQQSSMLVAVVIQWG